MAELAKNLDLDLRLQALEERVRLLEEERRECEKRDFQALLSCWKEVIEG